VTWLQGELERLFAPGYVDDLGSRSLEDLRAMRAEFDRAETAVSYLRRVVQGRLDVVQGVLRHAGSPQAGLASLIEELPAIMAAGPPRPAGPGRLPTHLAPDIEAADDHLTAEVDAVLDPGSVGELPAKSPAELEALSAQLVELEERISAQRRQLHERMDAVQAEIVERYKSGQVSPDGLLA
jgi:hypothetical protein